MLAVCLAYCLYLLMHLSGSRCTFKVVHGRLVRLEKENAAAISKVSGKVIGLKLSIFRKEGWYIGGQASRSSLVSTKNAGREDSLELLKT